MKDNSYDSESTGSGGPVDDADVTQEVAGAKTAIFGLAMDSIGRSTPTHMIPFYVRQKLFKFLSTTDGSYPWYSDEGDSLASDLAVTVSDAEAYGLGSPSADNAFMNYADVPLNPQSLDRLSFWRHNPEAIELDPRYKFEAQMYALDNFSQLFVESFDFHFHYLAVVDSEYHRLRTEGPLGQLDDSSETTAWFNTYHYWRAQVDAAYLQGIGTAPPKIVLPTGLQNGNWTIADVLQEILVLMSTPTGDLFDDLRITAKGATYAKTGATLGIKSDPGMTDNDGNPRFYVPAFDAWFNNATGTMKNGSTTSDLIGATGPVAAYVADGENAEFQLFWDQFRAGSAPEEEGIHTETSIGGENWNGRTMYNVMKMVQQKGRVPKWARPALQPDDPTQLDDMFTSTWHVSSYPTDFLGPLPGATGTVSGTSVGYRYYRGHGMNLVDMISSARRIGRALEPEVAEGFLPAFGEITNVAHLLDVSPSGMTARMYDDLYNLYAASFSYNENPARTYTAAHMGPVDEVLADGELVIADNNLTSNGLTIKERFWTPSAISDADEVATILSYFLPKSVLEGTMLGDINFTNTGTDGIAKYIDKELVSRLLGTTNSMHTKVEKPVVLPSGLATPEGAYASGMGQGAAELIMELLYSAFAGEPVFGLGHNGFIDWHKTSVANPGHYNAYNPRSRLEGMDINVDGAGFLGYSTDFSRVGGAAAINDIVESSAVFDGNEMLLSPGTLSFDSPAEKSVIEDWVTALSPTCGERDTVISFGKDEWSHLKSVEGRIQTRTSLGTSQTVQASGLDHSSQWGFPLIEASSPTTGPGMDGFANNLILSPWGGIMQRPAGPHSVWTIDQVVEKVTITKGVHTATWETGNVEDVLIGGVYYPQSVYPSSSITERSRSAFTQQIGEFVDTNQGFADQLQTVIVSNNNGKEVNLWRSDIEDGNTNDFGVSTHSSDVGSIGVPRDSPHDYALMALAAISKQDGGIEKMEQFMSGTQSLEVEIHMHAFRTENNYVESLGSVQAWKNSYELSWDRTTRAFGGTALPVTVEMEASRDELAGSTRVRAGDVKSTSRSVLKWNSSTNIPTVAGGPNHLTGFYSCEPPVAPGSIISKNFGVVGVAHNPRQTPAGEWNDLHMNYEFTLIRENLAALNDGDFTLDVNVAALEAWSGTILTGYDTYMSMCLNYPGARVSSLTAGFPVPSYNGMNSWGTFPLGSTGTAWLDTYGSGSSPFLKWQKGNKDVLNLTAGYNGDSLTYIIPDDPDVRMVYRPYRRNVDAAIAREQRLLFMPTHEKYSGTGGPFGLPCYGTPSLFRLAQLHYDANKADQFILEKAATKTRMVNPANRGLLTFSKVTLLDPTTERHLLPETIKAVNNTQYTRGTRHASSYTGVPIYTREMIRAVQMGRQYQRFA